MNDPAPGAANALGGVNWSVRVSGEEVERNAESGKDLEARWMPLVVSLARRRFRRKREVRREGMLCEQN